MSIIIIIAIVYVSRYHIMWWGYSAESLWLQLGGGGWGLLSHAMTKITAGFTPSSKLHLFPHKLLIWPPCGTVLTGGIAGSVPSSSQAFSLTTMWYFMLTEGMHNESDSAFKWLGFDFSWCIILLSVVSELAPLCHLKVLFRISWSSAPLLCFSLWGKHGSQFFAWIVIVAFWMAEVLRWLAAQYSYYINVPLC